MCESVVKAIDSFCFIANRLKCRIFAFAIFAFVHICRINVVAVNKFISEACLTFAMNKNNDNGK